MSDGTLAVATRLTARELAAIAKFLEDMECPSNRISAAVSAVLRLFISSNCASQMKMFPTEELAVTYLRESGYNIKQAQSKRELDISSRTKTIIQMLTESVE